MLAAKECQFAIEKIGSKGAAVKVFAQVGPAIGRAAFSDRGIDGSLPMWYVVESTPTPNV